MTDLATLKAECLSCWQKAQVVPSRLAQVNALAKRACAPVAKAAYQQIAQKVWGSPDRWWFIPIVHYREADFDFSKSIAQGDPWDAISTHVPRGIGPFDSFSDAAVFTLTRCAPYPAKWTDWTIGGVLTLFILYNGTGYEDYHHEVSPYDWGATTMEEEGKYVADGKYNPSVWDTQVGAAAMLGAMVDLDSSIYFEDAA